MSKEQFKQIKNLEKQNRDVRKELDVALRKHAEAEIALADVMVTWKPLAEYFGQTPDEVIQSLTEKMHELQEEKATAYAQANELQVKQLRYDSGVELFAEETRKVTQAIEAREKSLGQQEQEVNRNALKLKAALEEASLKKARRRLQERGVELDKEKERSAMLEAEVTRQTQEVIQIKDRYDGATHAIKELCARFNLDVALDLYQGKPIFNAGAFSIRIPPGGLVLDFWDEDLTVTPQDFGAALDDSTTVSMDLFCEVANNKNPERWRVGMHGKQLALFARGKFKVPNFELIEYQPKGSPKEDQIVEDEQAVPIDEPKPTPKNIHRIRD